MTEKEISALVLFKDYTMLQLKAFIAEGSANDNKSPAFRDCCALAIEYHHHHQYALQKFIPLRLEISYFFGRGNEQYLTDTKDAICKLFRGKKIVYKVYVDEGKLFVEFNELALVPDVVKILKDHDCTEEKINYRIK